MEFTLVGCGVPDGSPGTQTLATAKRDPPKRDVCLRVGVGGGGGGRRRGGRRVGGSLSFHSSPQYAWLTTAGLAASGQ